MWCKHTKHCHAKTRSRFTSSISTRRVCLGVQPRRKKIPKIGVRPPRDPPSPSHHRDVVLPCLISTATNKQSAFEFVFHSNLEVAGARKSTLQRGMRRMRCEVRDEKKRVLQKKQYLAERDEEDEVRDGGIHAHVSSSQRDMHVSSSSRDMHVEGRRHTCACILLLT